LKSQGGFNIRAQQPIMAKATGPQLISHIELQAVTYFRNSCHSRNTVARRSNACATMFGGNVASLLRTPRITACPESPSRSTAATSCSKPSPNPSFCWISAAA